MTRVSARGVAVAVAGLVLAGAGLVVTLASWPAEGRAMPTARVARGKVDLSAHATGELRAVRTAPITAPPIGGTLRILRLAPAGAPVEAGGVVVEFDKTEQEYALEQSRSELAQAEQEIVKLHADTAVQAAEDQVALLKARFAVRRAELDARGNAFVGAIDARKNQLAFEEARRRLAELEADVASRGDNTRAAVQLADEKRTKARIAMDRARRDIASMTLTAPFAGVVSIGGNRDATGGIFFSGMTLPDYQPGDMVYPGRLIAQVLDVSRMEIRAKVDETDRPRVAPGGPASVELDAILGAALPGVVRSVSGLASRGFFDSSGPVRRFDAVFELEKPDPRLRPGMTARILITAPGSSDVLYVPRQAVFERDGRPVVYVQWHGAFEAAAVTVKARTETQAIVEGVGEGAVVALVDPEAKPAALPATRAAAGPAGGGR